MILQDRLTQVLDMQLSAGAHESIESGACVMELVSYVTGEPWSDAPQCACPVITAFCVSWNDSLPDADRTRLLKPLIPLIVGTRSTKGVEERRSYMALDWLIRVFTPKWLDTVPALHEHAKALRELDAIADMAGAAAAGVKVRAAGAAAGDAARDAAWAAAGAAAWDAARDAAGDALRPTTEWLQASALTLVDQMIEVAA